MSPSTDPPLPATFEGSLAELESIIGDLLERMDLPAGDGRAQARPDARTLRWYQTLGLLDKPLRYDGRSAVYGWRHVVQALAVKVLQGSGLRLDQVQQALAAQPFSAIEQAVLAAIPSEGPLPPASAEPLGSRYWVELGPGITLLLDPQIVSDPRRVIRLFRSALNNAPGGQS